MGAARNLPRRPTGGRPTRRREVLPAVGRAGTCAPPRNGHGDTRRSSANALTTPRGLSGTPAPTEGRNLAVLLRRGRRPRRPDAAGVDTDKSPTFPGGRWRMVSAPTGCGGDGQSLPLRGIHRGGKPESDEFSCRVKGPGRRGRRESRFGGNRRLVLTDADTLRPAGCWRPGGTARGLVTKCRAPPK